MHSQDDQTIKLDLIEFNALRPSQNMHICAQNVEKVTFVVLDDIKLKL